MYLLYIMKRKLNEEERRIRQTQYYSKYRQTDKGLVATRKAALRYYHKTKILKKMPFDEINGIAICIYMLSKELIQLLLDEI